MDNKEGTHDEPADLGQVYDQLEMQSNTEQETVQQVTEPTETIEAPSHWDQDARERFNQLEPGWRQWLLDRHRSMEGDYTRKTQEIAEARRQYENQLQYAEQVNHIWSPLVQTYGQDPLSVQRQAAEYIQWYKRDPQGFVNAFAKQAGIELPQHDDDMTDPALRQLRDQIGQLTQSQLQQQQMQQRAWQYLQAQNQQAAQQAQQEQLRQEVSSEIESFTNAKDQSGKPLHPHFAREEVREHMSALMSQYPHKYGLQEAYEIAVRALPQVSNPADKVRQARLAASGVQGGRGPTADLMQMSQKDALSHLYDQLNN